jgi:hypothetical protein
MFSLDQNFFSEIFYLSKIDFYFKPFICFLGIFLFLEGIRNQISEIDLLQLVPGFYFFLCFILFLIFLFLSELILRIPLQIDSIQSIGTKTKNKMELNILLKLSFFLFSNLLLLIVNTILPLSLDYFNNSGEKTLENIWSLNEVILLEVIFLILLLFLSQTPLFFLINFNTKKTIKILSQFWKILILGITIAAGFFTPTLDGYTQLSFASFTLSFYLFLVNSLQKKLFLKLNIFVPFGA